MTEVVFPKTYTIIVNSLTGLRGRTGSFYSTLSTMTGLDEHRQKAIKAARDAIEFVARTNYYFGDGSDLSSYFEEGKKHSSLKKALMDLQKKDFSAIDRFSPVAKTSELLRKEIAVTMQMALDAREPFYTSSAAKMAGLQMHYLKDAAMDVIGPWWDHEGESPAERLANALGYVAAGHDIPLLELVHGIHNLKTYAAVLPDRPEVSFKDRAQASDMCERLVSLGEATLRQALERVSVPSPV